MIDLHSHILPGLDDGAGSMEESLAMCDLAIKDGIHTILATPHNLNGVHSNSREAVSTSVLEFNKALVDTGRRITVLPGSDTHIHPELSAFLERGEIMTVNDGNRFLMIEFPTYFIPEQVSEQIFRLKVRGITCIVTHPERNAALMDDINVLFDFIHGGALSQITAGSITGHFGKAPMRFARRIIEHNMAHIIATDAHNSTSRPPILSSAVEAASRIAGEDEARRMVTENPAAILRGETPPIREPVRFRKRTFFSFFGLGGLGGRKP